MFSTLGFVAAALTIFSFMLTDFFDTIGTATAVVEQAELTDEEGKSPVLAGCCSWTHSARRAAAAGVKPTRATSRARRVSPKGRTGLTSIVVGVLFLLAIFLSPLAGLVPAQAGSGADPDRVPDGRSVKDRLR